MHRGIRRKLGSALVGAVFAVGVAAAAPNAQAASYDGYCQYDEVCL